MSRIALKLVSWSSVAALAILGGCGGGSVDDNVTFEDFAATVTANAGPTAENCGTAAVNASHATINCCIARNDAQGLAAFAIYRQQGTDSFPAVAFSRNATGVVTQFNFDSDPSGGGSASNGNITGRTCNGATIVPNTCNDFGGLPYQCPR